MDNNRRHEQIVFCKDDYNGDKDKLFQVITTQVRILLDAGYLVIVRYDEPELGIVVVEFEHNEYLDPWGAAYPVWMTEDEEFKFNQYIESLDETNS